jgi:hypothetical protein
MVLLIGLGSASLPGFGQDAVTATQQRKPQPGDVEIQQTDFGITPYSNAFGAFGGADPLQIFGDLFVVPTDNVASAGIPARLWSFVGKQA